MPILTATSRDAFIFTLTSCSTSSAAAWFQAPNAASRNRKSAYADATQTRTKARRMSKNVRRRGRRRGDRLRMPSTQSGTHWTSAATARIVLMASS